MFFWEAHSTQDPAWPHGFGKFVRSGRFPRDYSMAFDRQKGDTFSPCWHSGETNCTIWINLTMLAFARDRFCFNVTNLWWRSLGKVIFAALGTQKSSQHGKK
jgi:hypothetical protein